MQGSRTVNMYLEGSKYCDISHPQILKIASQIRSVSKTRREMAIQAFYWVRDHILYRVGNWNQTASETLAEGFGTCTNKANLLVALLRACGIPAGYGIMTVHSTYLGPMAIPMFSKYIKPKSTHIYALVHLDGKWIKIDPSDDRELCRNTHYFNYTTQLVEWDGFHHACLNLRKQDIISDIATIADITPIMVKKPCKTKIIVGIANQFIDFARKNTRIVKSQYEIEMLYKRFLKQNSPALYYSFILACYYNDIKLLLRRLKLMKMLEWNTADNTGY